MHPQHEQIGDISRGPSQTFANQIGSPDPLVREEIKDEDEDPKAALRARGLLPQPGAQSVSSLPPINAHLPTVAALTGSALEQQQLEQ